MKFSEVNAVRIPSGKAKKIRHNGKLLWEPYQMRYVSLGDSIAAGYLLDGHDETKEYSKGGNTAPTLILDKSYTGLIRGELKKRYGRTKATSFACSGDTVADLMEKLDHADVSKSVAGADLVTLCIGANDVLQTAMDNLNTYINDGHPALQAMGQMIQANLDTLNGTGATSYTALFDKLSGINPTATYVFTTVYNPLKYLWLDESTGANDYKDGFFGPLMWAIPDDIGDYITNQLRSSLYETDVVQMVFDRINGPSRNGTDGLAAFTETYITKLNTILRDKIAAYGNPKFVLADTKAVFDPVPDRPISAPKHYNDLVNVEMTRGYVVEDLDWGQFWSNVNWWDIAGNIASFDFESLMADVMENVVNNVIIPDIDPHPEEYGHHALYCSFADALGWETLPRRTITYNPGAYGVGSMPSQTLVALDDMVAYTNILPNAFQSSSGEYVYSGWLDNNGVAYMDGQLIGLSSDITLTARWGKIILVRFAISKDADTYPAASNAGPTDYYGFYINGVKQPSLPNFSDNYRDYYLPEGTVLKAFVGTKVGDTRSYITYNGATVAGKGNAVEYSWTLTAATLVNFEWNANALEVGYSYWNCYIST